MVTILILLFYYFLKVGCFISNYSIVATEHYFYDFNPLKVIKTCFAALHTVFPGACSMDT